MIYMSRGMTSPRAVLCEHRPALEQALRNLFRSVLAAPVRVRPLEVLLAGVPREARAGGRQRQPRARRARLHPEGAVARWRVNRPVGSSLFEASRQASDDMLGPSWEWDHVGTKVRD